MKYIKWGDLLVLITDSHGHNCENQSSHWKLLPRETDMSWMGLSISWTGCQISRIAHNSETWWLSIITSANFSTYLFSTFPPFWVNKNSSGNCGRRWFITGSSRDSSSWARRMRPDPEDKIMVPGGGRPIRPVKLSMVGNLLGRIPVNILKHCETTLW